ncbi:hypothetical protein GOBAR_AA25092 [Gossypium barbadense]|uniref:RING-type domain-containing protein n=1 Tax=Gossypium barbadense TaxID=3634 RepID=A0A2P5WWX9_GOSBA|nr:hypothetical protein GOBAR_AA25092 [Gossypium barbadense]
MISGGLNLVMTVIGFTVSIMFIVFICTRLICARVQLRASRRPFAISSRSDLNMLERGLHGIEPVVVANFPTKTFCDECFSANKDAQSWEALGMSYDQSYLLCELVSDAKIWKFSHCCTDFVIIMSGYASNMDTSLEDLGMSYDQSYLLCELVSDAKLYRCEVFLIRHLKFPKLNRVLVCKFKCTVCLSEYRREDVLRILPYCGHSFHVTCIDLWLQQHSTCPVCRISLRELPEKKRLMQPLFSSADRSHFGTESFNMHTYNCLLRGHRFPSRTSESPEMDPNQENSFATGNLGSGESMSRTIENDEGNIKEPRKKLVESPSNP